MAHFRLCLLFFALIFFPELSSAQNYLWPTNASHYLTSSFAEYRPGHFHAGIDIKTWGKEGYKVFAIRDGYIWQIRVSPFGYGKVIYQKLDTGEIAVYAHLSKFNPGLEKVVKREQKRRGKYRISKYFNAGQFPVKKGDVIGYTGSTGIGYPHLHFELRDKQNRPINPFSRGYRVKDRVRPHIAAIGFIPLEGSARINGDVVPVILKLNDGAKGEINLEDTILVSGKIGLAVQCWDQANDVHNKFAVHRLRLFVDGELRFAVQYDRFSYAETHFIDFDRNYRLRKRGIGLFQNLFKIKYNGLKIYQPPGQEIGVLQCNPENAEPNIFDSELSAGKHFFRIEAIDYWNNLTAVNGSFVVSHKKSLSGHFVLEKDTLRIERLQDQFGRIVSEPKVWIFGNGFSFWNKAHVDYLLDEKTNNGSQFKTMTVYPVTQESLLKITATDSFGIESYPYFYIPYWKFEYRPSETEIRLEKDFYDDYVRFRIVAEKGIFHTPQMIVHQNQNEAERIYLVQKDLNEFIGVYQLKTSVSGELTIDISGYDQNMAPVAYQEKLFIHPVLPSAVSELTIDDGNCRIFFREDRVYDPLFLRYEIKDSVKDSAEPLLSKLYEFFPQDVLLKGSAQLTLKYPENDSLPEKLAIYGFYGKSWGFVDNKLDKENKTISANIGGLGAFALLRDTEPPEIYIFPPRRAGKAGVYVFRSKITDKLAGIANEMSLAMKIDGAEVIAEYDPEFKTLTYTSETPLLPGRHEVRVSAVDRSGNRSVRSRSFLVK